MRKITKNKCGFTLVELIVVVAIILIIAGVTALSISTLLKRAQDSDDSINDEVEVAKNNISVSEHKLASYGF